MSNAVVFPTDIFRVTAVEAEERKDLTVYTSLTGECTMQEANRAPAEVLAEYNAPGSWCRARTRKIFYVTYTFSERVTLEIELPEGIEIFSVKPREAASTVRFEGGRAFITTEEPLYLMLSPAGDIFGGLRVLLGKEKPEPRGFAHVIRFEDGIYTAENCDAIRIDEHGTPVIDGIEDDTLIWIGKDAIVNAAIELKTVRNVTVAGSGILTLLNRCHGAESGFAEDSFWGLFRYYAKPNILIRSGCKRIVVDGPLLDCEFRGIVLRNSEDIEIRNVKIFTSGFNGDAINCYNTRRLLVEDCFLHSEDDAFCMYNSCDSIPTLFDEGFDGVTAVCGDVEFRRNIIYTNCRPFVFGGHATGATDPRCLIENINIHDVRIIETPVHLYEFEEEFSYYWSSVFRILSQSEQIVRNITFENITVDVTKGYNGKIFHLHVRSSKEASYTESRGWQIENIRFKNIDIRGCTEYLYPSVIMSREIEEDETDAPRIADVVFENVTIDGEPIEMSHFNIKRAEESITILP